VNTLNQTVNGFAIGREDLPPGGGVRLELLTECPFHVAATQEGLPQSFGIGG
jgi:hypothetical protein